MELQIKRILNERHLTNRVLARKLGVSEQYIGTIVNGKAGASFDKYEKIADMLGVKLWQLFADPSEYTLTDGKTPAKQPPLNFSQQIQADITPDLITVDRQTGETRRYMLLPDAVK